jgi:hypothetical protein
MTGPIVARAVGVETDRVLPRELEAAGFASTRADFRGVVLLPCAEGPDGFVDGDADVSKG